MTKITITFIFCLLTIIVDKSNCGVIIMGNGFTSTDRFNIYENNGVFHCGSLNCPVGSRCIITQKNNHNNTAQLITREKCFNQEDDLIQQSEFIEAGDPNNIVNQRIETGSGGSFIYNPELQKEIQENVQRTVSDTLQNVQKSLHNIFNKRLVPDFGDEFPFGPKNSPFGPGFPFNNDYVPNNNEGVGNFVPLTNDGKPTLNPNYDISEQNNPSYKNQNREDIDDSDEDRNAIPKI